MAHSVLDHAAVTHRRLHRWIVHQENRKSHDARGTSAHRDGVPPHKWKGSLETPFDWTSTPLTAFDASATILLMLMEAWESSYARTAAVIVGVVLAPSVLA